MQGQCVTSLSAEPRISPLERWRLVLPALAVGTGALLGAVVARTGDVGVGAGLVLAAAAALVAMARPDWAAVALVTVIPALPGLRRGLPLPGLRLTEVLIAGCAVVILVSGLRRRWRLFDTVAVLYVVTSVGLGVLAAGGLPAPADRGVLFGPLQFLLLYAAVSIAVTDLRTVRRCLRGVLLASVPVSVIALLEKADAGPVRELIVELTASGSAAAAADAAHRSAGPFAHWHSLGGYLVVVLVLIAALGSQPGQQVLRRRWLTLLAVLATLALASTVTFVAVGGAAVGVAVVALRTRSVRLVLAICAGALLLGLTLGDSLAERLGSQYDSAPVGSTVGQNDSLLPQTVAFRVDVWTNEYAPILGPHLLSGYGPGLPPGVDWTSTESVYLSLLLRGGVILMGVYALLMVAMWRLARIRQSSALAEHRGLSLCLTTLLPVAAVMQLVHPYFLDAGFPHLLWSLAALLAASVAAAPNRPPVGGPNRSAGTTSDLVRAQLTSSRGVVRPAISGSPAGSVGRRSAVRQR